MSWELDGRPLDRVLVSRLRYLGDVVMSTVVPRVLRRGDPGLTIDFLCEDAHAGVLDGHPDLDRVHRLGARRRGADARARAGHDARQGDARGTLGTVAALRRERYDLAVDLFFNPRSAWLLRGSGIRFRIGGTRGSRRRLYTHTVPGDAPPLTDPRFRERAPGGLGDHLGRLAPLRHAETGRDFLSWFREAYAPGELLPHLAGRPPDEAGRRALLDLGIDPAAPYLLAAPGATWPTKEWPLEHWARFLADRGRAGALPLAVVVPPGRAGDFAPLSGSVPRGRGGVLPGLPLGSILGVVGSAAGLVTVDGGLMHAAVGLNVPTLALFGPTPPDLWFPYTANPRFRVLATRPPCHPCDLLECGEFICLPDLAPAAVNEALESLLEAVGP